MFGDSPKLPPVKRYETAGGVRIYRIACQAFPELVVNAYFVVGAGPPTLVDCGSGFGQCNAQLLAGLQAVGAEFGEIATLEDIRRIIITHGHIDHFGGLPFVVDQLQGNVEVAIHELDQRILTGYEERVVLASKALGHFLQRAGVAAEQQAVLLSTYGSSKRHVRNLHVDRTLVDGQEFDGLHFIHVPGHCPGQVCIGIDNVLLSADHILPMITPHQAPESITAYTGLGHYLESLAKVRAIGGFELALGGHEGPIADVNKRIDEIRASHLRKLDKILELIRRAPEPVTIDDVTQLLYSRVRGFHVLLALEEVGAHVEYLYAHAQLAVANLAEIEAGDNRPIRYRVAG
jgi:glyoxylase-like metal-dependent hydrolase (beta-lactamase superfamily II)